MLVLQLTGQPGVQVVRLDDPTYGYARQYAHTVAKFLPAGRELLWSYVDAIGVAEYGPNDIARLLLSNGDVAGDLPQVWETVPTGGSGAPGPRDPLRSKIDLIARRGRKAPCGHDPEYALHHLGLAAVQTSSILHTILDRLEAAEQAREGETSR